MQCIVASNSAILGSNLTARKASPTFQETSLRLFSFSALLKSKVSIFGLLNIKRRVEMVPKSFASAAYDALLAPLYQLKLAFLGICGKLWL